MYESRKTHISVLICILAVLTARPPVPAEAAPRNAPTARKISWETLNRRLGELNPSVHYGGLMIGAGETKDGPVVVVDGTLDIQDGGVLEGDAWVVGGRLILTGGARVNGEIHLVNSELFRSREARAAGTVERYTCECRFDADHYEKTRTLKFVEEKDPLAIDVRPAVEPGLPTRVQYTLLRAGLERENPLRTDRYVSGYAMAEIPAWTGARGHVGFDAAINVPLWERWVGVGADVTFRGYKKPFTNDAWQVSRTENAAILLLTGWEFADYFERRGGEAELVVRFSGDLRVGATVYYGRDVSLETCKAPSLFQSNRRLPGNPGVDDGVRTTVSLEFTYDARREREHPGDAWYARLWGEKGIADGPGEFSYEAFSIDVRRYTSLPAGIRMDVRSKLFSTLGRVPRQLYQSLGGYGGVRGLPDRPFETRRGDRLCLFSCECRRRLPDAPLAKWLFTTWNLVVFADAGVLAKAWSETDAFGFLETRFADWGKSAGIGVSGESFLPYVGVYAAWNLDGDDGRPRVIARIEKSF